MIMMILLLSVALGLLAAVLYLASRKREKKLAFPGPKGLPLFGSFFEMRTRPMHDLWLEWSVKYGGVFTFSLFGKQFLVVSSPDALHEILVTRSNDFGGRPKGQYRNVIITEGFQDIAFQPNLVLHKALRQIVNRTVNAFGRGRGRLEVILDATVDNLMDNFQKKEGAPFDAREDIYEATTLTILTLVSKAKRSSSVCPSVRHASCVVNISWKTYLLSQFLTYFDYV